MGVDGLLHGLLLFFALDCLGTASAAGATAAASTSVFFFGGIVDGGHGHVEKSWKWERPTDERSLVFGHKLAVKYEDK
jgi:hypothetical protein